VKVILFGATGMAGQVVLRECLHDPDLEVVSRSSATPACRGTRKCNEIIHQDVFDRSAIKGPASHRRE
jgi:hypothetical protein